MKIAFFFESSRKSKGEGRNKSNIKQKNIFVNNRNNFIIGKSLKGHHRRTFKNLMELLNIRFVLLIIKMAMCILPGVGGIFLLVSSEEIKREMRNRICSQLFGVSNAIPYPRFATTLTVIGVILIVLSLVASWFFLLRGFI